MAAFLDVVLRGLALCGQALAIGGVPFALLILGPAASAHPILGSAVRRSLTLAALGAAVVALAQVLSFATQLTALLGAGGWPLRVVVATTFFRIAAIRVVMSLALVVACLLVRRRPDVRWGRLVLAGMALGLAVSAAWASHAAARPGARALPLAFDTLHQLAAAVWVGGLGHLVAAGLGRRPGDWAPPVLRRFSMLALGAVALLVVAGVALARDYVGTVPVLFQTAYGSMVLAKATILGGLGALGAVNFGIVRRLGHADALGPARIRRLVEVELGLGLTALFVAASLTSLPPAIDLVADRATFAEVALRFTPRWPTLTSPSLAAMPVDDAAAPRTDADRAWSEFNHNVAGLFVVAMGLLAILHATGRAPWARHWPLILLGLAAFLLVRDDPGSWPLGPEGFWEGMTDASVLQHRIFVLLVVVFAAFEWMVRTGRLRTPGAALVFPLACAVGGGLLLTHSHASLNLKEEFLTEVTHIPLGLLAMVTGWGRWFELRLSPAPARGSRWIWTLAFTAVGVLLVLYREH